ncbi:MAG: ABC transporter ATP-binding protein [Granulosicoccus sp.]
MNLLDVAGLQAGYGSSEVLFDITLRVGESELVTLLGRNGMGKTTTLNSIMGLVTPSSGQINWQGNTITGKQPYEISRAGIALVPEGRQIFPNLTARENLVATAVSEPKMGESWTLDRVLGLFPQLESRLESMGNLLSGGEQQMLAIGRALMTNPCVLLLDDATEGLAPKVREEIWRCLTQLKETGIGLVVVDKNVDDLLPIANNHYVVEKGRIAWQGNTQQWRESPEIRTRYLGV